jgi:hypothetical protein
VRIAARAQVVREALAGELEGRIESILERAGLSVPDVDVSPEDLTVARNDLRAWLDGDLEPTVRAAVRDFVLQLYASDGERVAPLEAAWGTVKYWVWTRWVRD